MEKELELTFSLVRKKVVNIIVYKITNMNNGREYVGRTVQSLEDRIRGYKKEIYVAKKGIRRARPIIKAMIEEGFENFKFEILERADTEEELDLLEEKYIKELETLVSQGGYNDMRGNIDRRMSERTKNLLRKSASEKVNWDHLPRGADHKSSIPVIELTTGLIFNNSLEADEFFGIKGSRDVTSGCSGSIGGRVFRKLENGSIVTDSTLPVKSEVYDEILPEYRKYAKRANNNVSTPIIDLTSGTTYNTLREASRELGISSGNISRNVNGELGSVKGKVFRRVKEGKIETGDKFTRPSGKVLKNIKEEYKGVV